MTRQTLCKTLFLLFITLSFLLMKNHAKLQAVHGHPLDVMSAKR